MPYAAFGAKKYQSLVEHIPLDSFVKMPDVLGYYGVSVVCIAVFGVMCTSLLANVYSLMHLSCL